METGERIAYARGHRERLDEMWQMVGHICATIIQAPHASSETLTSLHKFYMKLAYPGERMEWEKSPSEKLAEILAAEGESFNPPIQ